MKTRQNMGKIHGGLAEKGVTLSVHPPASSRQSDAAECGFHCSDGTFRLRAATLRGQNDHFEGRKRPLRGAKTATREAEAQQKGREAQWLRPRPCPMPARSRGLPEGKHRRRRAFPRLIHPQALALQAARPLAPGRRPCTGMAPAHGQPCCPMSSHIIHRISHHRKSPWKTYAPTR